MQKGNDATDYDIVIGGAANDKVFNTVELYFDNLIDKKEAIHRLRYEKLNLMSICIMKRVNRFDSQSDFAAKKYAWIIERFSKKKNLSFDEALKFFYCSALYPLLCEGVSDLHCMSDEYLTEELIFEYEET